MNKKPIEVVKHGPFYRATQWWSTYPGSPQRALFSTEGFTVAWGRTFESAAERCRAKTAKNVAWDKQWHEERQAKTRRFPA